MLNVENYYWINSNSRTMPCYMACYYNEIHICNINIEKENKYYLYFINYDDRELYKVFNPKIIYKYNYYQLYFDSLESAKDNTIKFLEFKEKYKVFL